MVRADDGRVCQRCAALLQQAHATVSTDVQEGPPCPSKTGRSAMRSASADPATNSLPCSRAWGSLQTGCLVLPPPTPHPDTAQPEPPQRRRFARHRAGTDAANAGPVTADQRRPPRSRLARRALPLIRRRTPPTCAIPDWPPTSSGNPRYWPCAIRPAAAEQRPKGCSPAHSRRRDAAGRRRPHEPEHGR